MTKRNVLCFNQITLSGMWQMKIDTGELGWQRRNKLVESHQILAESELVRVVWRQTEFVVL